MNEIMLLIFVMVLCAWFWPNCPKVLKENKKLLLGVSLGFFFTKFMGNIEGVKNKEKRKRKGERKGKGNKKNLPSPSPSPIPVLNNHLDDYCASYLRKGDSDYWWTMNKREKCGKNCMLKGKLGDYLLPDDKIDQIDPEQISGWQSKWEEFKKAYGLDGDSYREMDQIIIGFLCNPSNLDFMFQNTNKYLNREGQTICQNCYSYPN